MVYIDLIYISAVACTFLILMSKESKIAAVFEHYTFQNTSTFTTFITVIMGLPITPWTFSVCDVMVSNVLHYPHNLNLGISKSKGSYKCYDIIQSRTIESIFTTHHQFAERQAYVSLVVFAVTHPPNHLAAVTPLWEKSRGAKPLCFSSLFSRQQTKGPLGDCQKMSPGYLHDTHAILMLHKGKRTHANKPLVTPYLTLCSILNSQTHSKQSLPVGPPCQRR